MPARMRVYYFEGDEVPELVKLPPGTDPLSQTTDAAKVAELNAQIAALQGQVTTLQGQVTAAQGQAATAQGQVTKLQGEKQLLWAAIDAKDLAAKQDVAADTASSPGSGVLAVPLPPRT